MFQHNVVLLSRPRIFGFTAEANYSIVARIRGDFLKAIMRALSLNGGTIPCAMEYIKMTPF